ncbi:aspartyl-phosphate phosphatase Spo0E family protein [Paenibacillus lentus]|uniref:Aspartyl-phosphate phosphatase Spo0E family protein n=1 Tax=Paenibacillus lentus TaxID=1338368 RepID=A0A3Q8S4W8_9BACL|nr:aspartyl-phosphate phosphatase Spo0E family protein [Paenibacillus lentus]AZK46711.1 aspartyl-phosphate phosphatase Spo0E family protein [Paenibacillus lentus]
MSGTKSKYIKHRIEEERQRLGLLAKQYGLQDIRVLKQSMELDQLINQYNEVKYDYMRRKEPIA